MWATKRLYRLYRRDLYLNLKLNLFRVQWPLCYCNEQCNRSSICMDFVSC